MATISAGISSVTIALTYTRVSKEDQARDGISLDAQLAAVRKYIAGHEGWVFGPEFQDVMSEITLLKREPQLARFFSLGERVLVVYNGRVYRVSSKQ